jgi:outer membrane protein OmpA-like peptidoglycan-associated protein
MYDKRLAVAASVVLLGLVAGGGCVTKKKFKTETERTDTRFRDVETSVETNERRVEDLRASTDRKVSSVEQQANQALSIGQEARSTAQRAAADAEAALKGRLIWTESLSDDKVKFNVNRAQLNDEARTALDDVVDRIKGYGKAVYVEIEGHTDSSGDATYNRRLSEERASAVRDYLHEQGIPLHAMNVIGEGEEDPIADNKTRTGRAQNRRVVIRVLE